MLKYQNRKFSNYYDLLIYMINTNQRVKESYFPKSDLYFCKIALEEKFKQKFRLKEVRELIKSVPKTLTATLS